MQFNLNINAKEHYQTNSIIKTKEFIKQVRDWVVEKFKARFGYKKNIASFESHRAPLNP